MGGVTAAFELRDYDPRTTRLRGSVHLQNSSAEPVLFGVSPNLFQHTDLLDELNHVVGPAAYFNAGCTRFSLGVAETRSEPFDVVLKERYILRPGLYRLLFVYDVRLLRRQQPGEFPILRWSTNCVVLRCE